MIGDRIKSAIRKKGLTQLKASELLGIDVGRLNHWITGRRVPPTEYVKKMCEVFGFSPNYLLYGETETNTISVIGYVQAGLWQEARQWEVSDFKPIYMPVDEKYKGKRIYALEVRGNSMNLLYPNGSCVICISVEDYVEISGQIESGKRVIVQRKNPLDGTIEATVKEYNKTKAGDFLMPRSTDPSFMPIRTDDGSSGEVKITGVVIGSFRNE